MKAHERKNWFGQLLEDHKKTPEFLLEQKILELTEKIVQRMEELGISRSVLADRLNVSKPYITKLLRGDVNFTLKSLAELSQALEADFDIDIFPEGASRQILRRYDNATGEVIAQTHTVLKQPIVQKDQTYSSDDYVATDFESLGGNINANTSAA
jgi:transcriptional regulator with XRE-family HTH domain